MRIVYLTSFNKPVFVSYKNPRTVTFWLSIGYCLYSAKSSRIDCSKSAIGIKSGRFVADTCPGIVWKIGIFPVWVPGCN